MNKMLPESSVLGLPVHVSDDYVGWLMSRLHQGQGGHVVTLNAEMAMQGESNPELASIIRQADLVIPDGAGVVLYLRLQGKVVRRCPGIELAESLLWEVGKLRDTQPVFFLGGSPGVAIAAAETWQNRIEGLAIASQHGYLSPSEEDDLAYTLKDLQPCLIFVALGVPRQEFWIAQHQHLCPQAIWIGVGGSLDIWAGVKSRAPAWLRDNHLEWLYRLYKEPWRWRRMLALPHFALKAVLKG